MRFKALIPEYDYSFDEEKESDFTDEEKESDFTFLDTMTKPVKFIDVILISLRESSPSLKRNSNVKETTYKC